LEFYPQLRMKVKILTLTTNKGGSPRENESGNGSVDSENFSHSANAVDSGGLSSQLAAAASGFRQRLLQLRQCLLQLFRNAGHT